MLIWAAEEEHNPLLPPLGEIIVGLIAFAVVLLVFFRFVAPRFEQVFRARREAIEGGIERAESMQAEAKAALERYQAQLAEARNAGESAAYQAEKQVKELGENIDEASKTEIDEAIKAVNEAVKGEDAEDIRAKTERLQTAFHKVSEAMYERAQAAQQHTRTD